MVPLGVVFLSSLYGQGKGLCPKVRKSSDSIHKHLPLEGNYRDMPYVRLCQSNTVPWPLLSAQVWRTMINVNFWLPKLAPGEVLKDYIDKITKDKGNI